MTPENTPPREPLCGMRHREDGAIWVCIEPVDHLGLHRAGTYRTWGGVAPAEVEALVALGKMVDRLQAAERAHEVRRTPATECEYLDALAAVQDWRRPLAARPVVPPVCSSQPEQQHAVLLKLLADTKPWQSVTIDPEDIEALKAGADALSAPALAAPPARMFPIQFERGAKAHPTRIPWWLADMAYSVYGARSGCIQSLERLAERGGFAPSEMDEYVPDWRERAVAAPPADLAALVARLQRLHRDIGTNRSVSDYNVALADVIAFPLPEVPDEPR